MDSAIFSSAEVSGSSCKPKGKKAPDAVASIVFGGTGMKILHAWTAAAAVTVLAGAAAMAADADRFTIKGDAAKQLLEQNSINIATAEAIGKACVDEAQKQG